MPPINVGYISSVLRDRGHEVKLFDFNIELYGSEKKDRKYLWHGETFQNFSERIEGISKNKTDDWVERVLSFDPQVVGFTVYHNSINLCSRLAKHIKNRNSEIKVIFGGPTFLGDVDNYSENDEALNGNVDYIVMGEGEKTIKELVEKIEREGKVHHCKGTLIKEDDGFKKCGRRKIIKDLNDLPFPSYDGLPLEKYTNQEKLGFLVVEAV